MISMDTWATIRSRCLRDGEKIKVVARELGLAPNTVRRYLRRDTSPKRIEPPRASLYACYQTHIDDLLRSTPKYANASSWSLHHTSCDDLGTTTRYEWRLNPSVRINKRGLRYLTVRGSSVGAPSP